MTVLGIETATDVCSVGIVGNDLCVVRSIRERRIHSEQLLPVLREAMEEASVGWEDIGGIALSSGPGSFTGLRIGASAAKGLLTAQPRPFVLIPTFEGIREGYRQGTDPADAFVICLDAKQDEWYVQEVGPGPPAGQLKVMTSDDLMALIGDTMVLTDVPERFADRPAVADLREWCNGAAIAALGRARLEMGERDDVRTFEPAYRKEFVARTVPKPVTPPKGAKET